MVIKKGEEYIDGSGKKWRILTNASDVYGSVIFLGVCYQTESRPGMETRFFLTNGEVLGDSMEANRLQLFDWRDLKKDDVVLAGRCGTEGVLHSLKRLHVDRIDDTYVYLYSDGKSSLTMDPRVDCILKMTPESIAGRAIKPMCESYTLD